MATVAEALRQFGPSYVAQFGARMPKEHRRVLALITRCRTGELGHLHYACNGCQRTHWTARSCGNRHCPNCQHDKTQRWLRKRMSERLPVPYFLVTFTVPATLRMVLRAHQRSCFHALFDCASRTLVELASGERFVGTDRLGFFGVLHTWGRDFSVYNPHIHFVVPGGGVSQDGNRWQACPENFLLPEKAAGQVFAGKFRDAMRKEELENEFLSADAKAWYQPWTVDVEQVGDGEAALKYLAPYVYRVAISNNRIESISQTHVQYRFTPSGTTRTVRRKVTGHEFVRAFLQHVVPSKFQRIRYYGFASPNSRLTLGWIRMLVWFFLGRNYYLAPPPQEPAPPKPRCKHCGGELILIAITNADGFFLYLNPRGYLDSG